MNWSPLFCVFVWVLCEHLYFWSNVCMNLSHHRRRLRHCLPVDLLWTAVSDSFHTLALDKLNVVFIETARAHQDTQEIYIVAQILQQRRAWAVDGENMRSVEKNMTYLNNRSVPWKIFFTLTDHCCSHKHDLILWGEAVIPKTNASLPFCLYFLFIIIIILNHFAS